MVIPYSEMLYLTHGGTLVSSCRSNMPSRTSSCQVTYQHTLGYFGNAAAQLVGSHRSVQKLPQDRFPSSVRQSQTTSRSIGQG